MKTEKPKILKISCSYKNLKHAKILLEDKVFVASIATLKYGECPDEMGILLRGLKDDYVKELEKKNK